MGCTTHHICVCKAQRLGELEKEVRKLRRENENMSKRLGDVNFLRDVKKACEDVVERLAPFAPYWED